MKLSDQEVNAINISWWIETETVIESIIPNLEKLGSIQKWSEESKGSRSYGDDRTNDISVWFNHETGRVGSIRCRVDLREPNREFIHNALEFALKFDCLLMDINGRLFAPTIDNFLDHLELSNAWKFISDPHGFIASVIKKAQESE
jgi:hypothetical protein